MRLFFALPLPGEAKDRLRAPLEAAKKAGGDGVSFTRIEQLHFTLAFLGEQPGPDEALAAIAPGEFARWTTREACLMQSVLGKGGATHTVLRAFPFR